ncbi:protein kinase domain-containing protein [Pseudonocardia adelaidensis]|uniref:Protein kinase domain-containing protein n=1 Tax=Pseudonocardia adelaidensis TaxID=648754 RepID=A0ABP9NQW6_9PSEU
MDPSTTLAPASIADYEVVGLLGEGPHARCYVARPPARSGELVAVKVFTERVGEPAFDRAVQELRAVAAVGSPHVVPVFDAVLGENFAYAMEYLPLGSLAEQQAIRPASAEVLAALEHAARGAHALHEAGIVHGGIHPGNVLLAEEANGTLGGRLAEPGLARVLMPGAVVPGAGRGGVLEFRDPDLLDGASPSRRTEVWALGATIHRVLSGGGLYGELPGHPLGAIRELRSTSPQVRPGLEPGEAAVVRDCIAEGAGRLRTAADVADRLAALRLRAQPGR